jgi:hypothetical protein
MYRMLVSRYANKLVKPKKQASYMVAEKKNEGEVPLAQAIELKRNGALMEEGYNPAAVEKYWNTWWEQKYIINDLVNSSMPTTRPPTRRGSPSHSLPPTSQATSTSDTPLLSLSRTHWSAISA